VRARGSFCVGDAVGVLDFLIFFTLADVVLICTVQIGREAGPVDIH
jgi:hypothetical protein